ncbi:MAG: hypothetical protein R3A11_07755 [Bdellovibrionota bacterium]
MNRPDPQTLMEQARTPQRRKSLSKAFFAILDHWNLTNEEKANLLGWNYEKKRHTIDAMKNGKKEVEWDEDKIRRMVEVINIHKSLRLLFPSNQKSLYGWVKKKRARFGMHSALDIMIEDGLFGIIAIRRYLDHVRTA